MVYLHFADLHENGQVESCSIWLVADLRQEHHRGMHMLS
jgi:hypothetical protein